MLRIDQLCRVWWCATLIVKPSFNFPKHFQVRRSQLGGTRFHEQTVRRWPHMERIADYLMPYKDDMEIGLLIGSDCPHAIIPREVIPGNDDNPYAKGTDLGWGIIVPCSWREGGRSCRHHASNHFLWCGTQLTVVRKPVISLSRPSWRRWSIRSWSSRCWNWIFLKER